MFWFIFLISSIVLSLILASFRKKYFFQFFTFFLIVFITPAQIETSTPEYAPAVFTFIFNIFLEQDFSIRVLRPLVLSIPLGIFSLYLYSFLKRRFF